MGPESWQAQITRSCQDGNGGRGRQTEKPIQAADTDSISRTLTR